MRAHGLPNSASPLIRSYRLWTIEIYFSIYKSLKLILQTKQTRTEVVAKYGIRISGLLLSFDA